MSAHEKSVKAWTMSIPAAGRKYFDLSRNGSYAAAERGDLGEILNAGRLKKVVVSRIEKKLQGETK
jgi:hypothetical protein